MMVSLTCIVLCVAAIQVPALCEAGLATMAQDYVRVLGCYVVDSVAGGHTMDQETVPGWVGYTATWSRD